MLLLEGNKLADSLTVNLRQQVENFRKKNNRNPHLTAILIGEDGASLTYVDRKVKACSECEIGSALIRLKSTITQNELLSVIRRLNEADHTDGILVQLPLPPQIRTEVITAAISPLKDVDGFHPVNLGRLAAGLPCLKPATPYGIELMLKNYRIETAGKHVVIVGRSNIVGRPLSIMLSAREHNATVTLCHSQTPDLKAFTRQADILIAALGKPGIIKADMIKDGVVLIDVGITRVSDSTSRKGYRIAGDADFNDVSGKCSAITPVPGGVGPMTIIGLLFNTIRAAEKEIKFE
ncbi:MAG: bifunctional 5,10-methylenetetrahydrofolate dehydrogenase/5,10-methenyltetrahydrofolate cyclohydrolase [Bacteroidia bacterium]|nr:bifunctional 5,10-methylenetetrahydrofolate dehydrogenase/5,10-methenyltetrahydrofolate cyclohydrolase [Bacteroidia bacterium]MCZ2277181.1 bifunctional 5,10-methylenetetrahydrofolate dehydrogenase/5,10-methenyltetrahydrofolate cyclohydrolase [Bacteroidia bacterium]